MAHIGDMGRGRGRGPGFGGEATRIGPAPTAPGGAPAAPTAEGALEGGLGGGGEELLDAGLGAGRMPGTGLGTGSGQGAGERGQPRTTTRPAMEAATFADALTRDTGGRRATAPETLVMPKEPEPPPTLARGGRTQERPALRDGGAPGDGPDLPEGRTASGTDTPAARGGTRIVRMADVQAGRTQGREQPRQGQGGEVTRIVKAPEKDNFGATAAPTTGTRIALRTSQVKVPVRPVQELIPQGLGKLASMETVAKRFASDLALLHQQVRPSDLPPSDRALRAWAFFTAYAEAATAQKPTPEGHELFDKALKKEGFGGYRDARTGQDGVKVAKWVLESHTPEQARERAGEVDIEPLVALEVLLSEAAKGLEKGKKDAAKGQEAPQKPESAKGQELSPKPEATGDAKTEARPEAKADAKADARPEAAKAQDTARRPEEARISQPRPQEAKAQDAPHRFEEARTPQAKLQELKDSAFTHKPERAPLERADAHPELLRVYPQAANNPPPVVLPPTPELKKRAEDGQSMMGRFEESLRKMDRGLRLGRNMLWNVLHQFRKGPGDSALEQEQWNQLVFAAMLAFVGLMLMIILVVSL